jgi:hypothetical protein
VELRLGKPTLAPLYNAACPGRSVSAWQSARSPAEVWWRTGDSFQYLLLAAITFLVCRIRTSTAVTKCARSIDARQGVPVDHLLHRA